MKKILLIVLLLALGISAVFVLTKKGGYDSSSFVAKTFWTKGNPEAQVILEEYSDFQCPACKAYYPVLKQLNQELGYKMKFVYHHFPLIQIHFNAELAGRAAEAAGKQGKFWEMHDMLFERQDEWAKSFGVQVSFEGYAHELGLNVEQFKTDINSKEVKARVAEDLRSGLKLDVDATPTFFLNGKKIKNPRSYGEFKELIQGLITK